MGLFSIRTRDERFNHGTRVKSPAGRLGTVIDDYITGSRYLYDKYHRVIVKWDDNVTEVRSPDTISVISSSTEK